VIPIPDLGLRADSLGNKRADQDFGLGMFRANNDFTLGSQQNANTAQRNWWDNVNTRDANSIAATGQENQFNLSKERNGIDWWNAQTNRGQARSQDYWTGQKFQRGY
jgi:hypothetical protein